MVSSGEKVVTTPDNSSSSEVQCKTDGVMLQGENSGKKKEETGCEEVTLEIEPKTKVSFPIRLIDGNQSLHTVGVCIKTFFGVRFNIYSFGIYMDTNKLKEVLKQKIRKVPEKITKEIYQMAIDSDVEMTTRMVFVNQVAMQNLRKHFDESIASSIKKCSGQKNPELAKKILAGSSDKTMLENGDVIEISRLPGNILQTKVLGEVVGKVESELLCRSYLYGYLGDDPVDKDAKEKFGKSLLSLL